MDDNLSVPGCERTQKQSPSFLVSGATLIDGAAEMPIEGQAIWIEEGRIRAIGSRDELDPRKSARVIDARGKFVIPGLMNANVHLFGDPRLETVVRYIGQYEDLIAESAQVALKSGLTTVFDTWGPRRHLMAVRDRINRGEIPGSRIFCAGNIIGFDGPFSQDFFPKVPEMVSAALVRRINAIWAENVGRHLMWLTPEQVGTEVQAYIAKGIDFIKYGANDHFPGAFLAFSPAVQEIMVAEAHRSGVTAQAHCMSVEGLRIAVEAGCNLITHCNITGPTPIPEKTLELIVKRGTGAVIFPWTERGLDWIKRNVSDTEWTMWQASDRNARSLIGSGAPLLLANDGAILAQEALTDTFFASNWYGAPEGDTLYPLATGHFFWFKAMEEKGCPPMRMLQAATRNIAIAYGKERDLGTLQAGKLADIIILDKNPLEAAAHYRAIHMIFKDGAMVDREALPAHPILTKPFGPPAEEEASHVPFLSARRFPLCGCH